MNKHFILCFIFFASLLSAQEVTSNLISNPFSSNIKFATNSSKLVLSVPFFDDFSYDGPSVNSNLWEPSSVFVNSTYPINPPTIGVATFDGLNEEGLARDLLTSTSSEPSDTLASKVIDLSNLTTAYFMFYYQAKGIGDAPQSQDKLVLEFLNNSVWVQKWSSNVGALLDFKKEVIIIDSAYYLTNNFQFRFRNYATISGNFDHWHIDYIKIDEFLGASDTMELEDVSFVYSSPTFLKRYYEMPWTHFLNNELSELKDSIDIKLRNNDASINVDYQYSVFENNNLIAHYPSLGSSRNVSILDYDTIGNYSFSNPPIDISDNIFSSSQADSASFLVQNIIGTASLDNKINDTLYHIQNFNSLFAYDDGSAESAYGININNAKLAYEFKLNRPDTLRAVQMYFPQMLDSVSHIPFRLTIWNNISGLGNIIYQQVVYPVHTENGTYHTYYLDSLFQLVGTFYVGWEQTTNDLLNIGLDKNNESNNYMFYNVGAGWVTSSYLGSWMIRPVLSMDEITLSATTIQNTFSVFPNPVESELFVETFYHNNTISIYSLHGILVKKITSESSVTKININDLSLGVYLLEVLNDKGREYQKIIVR